MVEMVESGFDRRVLLGDAGNRVTGADLGSLVRRGASVVASTYGSVVYAGENHPLLPVALFSAAWAGVPFVPLNYRLTGAELERLLASISAPYLVTDAARVESLATQAHAIRARDDFLARARTPNGRGGEWPMDPEAVAVLLFTSGTTGAPKAAVLRHRHLVSYILGSVEFGGAAPEDAALVSVPPYHIAGIAAILSSVYSGRR